MGAQSAPLHGAFFEVLLLGVSERGRVQAGAVAVAAGVLDRCPRRVEFLEPSVCRFDGGQHPRSR